ncbi:MAG: DUF1624 domain-containing protein [Acidobacteria bacterium]|nr:DUF1624 domain-containing protein [Acidobacteriota bacterium]
MAILLMLQGHTLHTVLASDARTGTAFYIWSFLRGLTACMFLLLSGFAFTFATRRHWVDHLTLSPTIGRRLRRFGFFLLLGYALHFPMAKLAHLYGMSEERWRSFLVVDVLQCIAVMLILLQGLVLVTRTPRRYASVAAVGCLAIVALTPAMWRFDWTGPLPVGLAAYLSPATGSLFPLFPWGAYVLLGAVLGDLYMRRGAIDVASFGNRVLLPGGVGLVALSIVGASMPLAPLGPTDFWLTSPNQFLLRAGLVLLVLGALAHISQRISRQPYVVQALAQESLTVYAIHLCIVYGSVWNVGLRQLVGPTLRVIPALGCIVVVWGAMALLASAWHWCKHREPGAAKWVRLGVSGLLLGTLI